MDKGFYLTILNNSSFKKLVYEWYAWSTQYYKC